MNTNEIYTLVTCLIVLYCVVAVTEAAMKILRIVRGMHRGESDFRVREGRKSNV